MRLVSRVSAFFKVALALSLLVNASILVTTVRYFLFEKFERQLHAALHTLVAAIEVEDDDAKWEPSDHTIALGAEEGLEDIRWVVLDEADQAIDRSRNLQWNDPADQSLISLMKSFSSTSHFPSTNGSWVLLNQQLAAPHPKPISERATSEHACLRVVVAGSTSEMYATQYQLAGIVAVISLLTWVLAGLSGNIFCRRALQPVREMAMRAAEIRSGDFYARLPVADHRDELAELASSFNGLLDRLQAAYEKQRRFAGDAAHQLKTPLTVLLGQIDVSLRRPRTVDEQVQTLSILRRQTLELQQIVESLLFLASAAGDRTLPSVDTKDLGLWIVGYIKNWSNHSRFGDLECNVYPGINFETSYPLLEQLLDNLLTNAFKYSLPDSPIFVSLSLVANRIEIVVEDRGIGIAESELSGIFDPFFRSVGARQSGAPGIGLGLAIVRNIAVALRAQITCESEVGRGSRFVLRFP